MGMIRVSDEVEKQLKSISDGRSMSATVEMLMTNVGPDGRINTEPVLSASNRDYFDKKFDELKALITDSLVDVVAAGGAGGGRAPGEKEWVKWDQMSYIIFNREDDDAAWILPEGAVFQFKNGDPDELAYYIKDGTIYIDGPQPVALLKVTPDIREAIDKNFTFND